MAVNLNTSEVLEESVDNDRLSVHLSTDVDTDTLRNESIIPENQQVILFWQQTQKFRRRMSLRNI
jgi:hypothetical protein